MYKEYIDTLIKTIDKVTLTASDGTVSTEYEEIMNQLVRLFSDIKKNGRYVFFIGNGGSAAIAGHMTADFMKNGGMKTYSLYDNSVTTCMGNDYGYEYVFSRPLEMLMNPGDLLIAISSSGNSENIVNAVKVAREKGGKIITLSGFKEDNKIKSMGDLNLHVPMEHYGIVESIHNLILQHVVDAIMEMDGVRL